MPPKKPAAGAKKVATSTSKKPTAAGRPAAQPAAAKIVEKPAAVENYQPPGVTVTLKQIPDAVFKDADSKLKNSGKWPLIIDPSPSSATYLRYQNCNYLNALDSMNMQPEAIRLGIIAALRYGKPFVLDMMDVDFYECMTEKMEQVLPGLLPMVMDKSILEEENYLKLVKSVDGDEYAEHNFSSFYMDNFKVIILTKLVSPSDKLLTQTYPIRVEVPE